MADELPKLIEESDVAKYFLVSKSTLETWRRRRRITHYRVGGRVLYAVNDILGYLDANRVDARPESSL